MHGSSTVLAGLVALACFTNVHTDVPDGTLLDDGYHYKKSTSSSNSNSYSQSHLEDLEINGFVKGQSVKGEKKSGFSTSGSSYSQSSSFVSGSFSPNAHGNTLGGVSSSLANSNVGRQSQIGFDALPNPGTGFLQLQNGATDRSEMSNQIGHSKGDTRGVQYWWMAEDSPFKPQGGCNSNGCSISGSISTGNGGILSGGAVASGSFSGSSSSIGSIGSTALNVGNPFLNGLYGIHSGSIGATGENVSINNHAGPNSGASIGSNFQSSAQGSPQNSYGNQAGFGGHINTGSHGGIFGPGIIHNFGTSSHNNINEQGNTQGGLSTQSGISGGLNSQSSSQTANSGHFGIGVGNILNNVISQAGSIGSHFGSHVTPSIGSSTESGVQGGIQSGYGGHGGIDGNFGSGSHGSVGSGVIQGIHGAINQGGYFSSGSHSTASAGANTQEVESSTQIGAQDSTGGSTQGVIQIGHGTLTEVGGNFGTGSHSEASAGTNIQGSTQEGIQECFHSGVGTDTEGVSQGNVQAVQGNNHDGLNGHFGTISHGSTGIGSIGSGMIQGIHGGHFGSGSHSSASAGIDAQASVQGGVQPGTHGSGIESEIIQGIHGGVNKPGHFGTESQVDAFAGVGVQESSISSAQSGIQSSHDGQGGIDGYGTGSDGGISFGAGLSSGHHFESHIGNSAGASADSSSSNVGIATDSNHQNQQAVTGISQTGYAESQKPQKPFETVHTLKCSGIGKICVAKHKCIHGFVSLPGILQVNNQNQKCDATREVCCTLKKEHPIDGGQHTIGGGIHGDKPSHSGGSTSGGLFGSGGESEIDLNAGDNSGYPGETNGYLPPIGGSPSSNVPAFSKLPKEPAGRDEQPSNTKNQFAFAPVQPQLGCAAALICVEEQYCTMLGMISETPVTLTSEQLLRRVPMVDCKNPDNGVIGKCCRDPNYVDPWPAGNLPINYSGGFDEQGFPTFLNISKTRPKKPVQTTPLQPLKPLRPQVQQPSKSFISVTRPVQPLVPLVQPQPTFQSNKIVPKQPDNFGQVNQDRVVVIQPPKQPAFQPQQSFQVQQPIFHPQQPTFHPQQPKQPSFQPTPFKPKQPVSQPSFFQPKQPSTVFVAQTSEQPEVIVQQPEVPGVFIHPEHHESYQPEQTDADQVIHQQPEQPIPFQPQQLTPLQPEQPAPFHPEQPAPFHPEQSAPHQPQQPSPLQPEQPAPFQPEQSAPLQPEQPALFQPEQPASFQPEQPPTFQPEQSASFHPEQPTSFQPEKSASFQPEQSVSFQPQQPATYQPQQSTPFKPQQPAPFKPQQPAPFQTTVHPQQPIKFGHAVVTVDQPDKTINVPSIQDIPNQITQQNSFGPQGSINAEASNGPSDVSNNLSGASFPNFPGFGRGQESAPTNEIPVIIAHHTPGAQCGIINQVQHPGGLSAVDTAFGEIPWMAMVLKNSEKKLLCSGVIVAPNLVITAANCVYGQNPSDISIKAGEWKLGYELKHEEPLPFEIIQVENIVTHPSYVHGAAGFDIAMLFLQSSIRLDQHIDTICVGDSPPVVTPQRKCISTGWGKTVLQVHAAGALMHKIDIDVLSNAQCRQRLQGAESPIDIDDSLVCAKAHKQSNNLCQVDVGGPLACDRGDGNYELVGVYSQDTGCLPTNQVATFTLIDNEWVKSMIAGSRAPEPLAVVPVAPAPIEQVNQPEESPSRFHYHQPGVPCDCQQGTQPGGANQYLPPV